MIATIDFMNRCIAASSSGPEDHVASGSDIPVFPYEVYRSYSREWRLTARSYSAGAERSYDANLDAWGTENEDEA